MCGETWPTPVSFVLDPDVQYQGYQANEAVPERGLFLFTHVRVGCSTTMALEAADMLPILYGVSPRDHDCNGRFCPIVIRGVEDLQPGFPPFSMDWVGHAIEYLRSQKLPLFDVA
ncbi:hypothetical protein GF324_10825 [bacterium]|nr:hypothetical protein [bacterium]